MFLVFGNERNVYDQRFLEFAVKKKKPGVNVIRRTIQDLSDQATLGKNKELIVYLSKNIMRVNLLPPEYEVRGKVMFSVCLFTGEGIPLGLWSQILPRGSAAIILSLVLSKVLSWVLPWG